MQILYDSTDEKFKKPFGCLRQNEKCTLNFYAPAAKTVKAIFTREDGFSLTLLFSETDSGFFTADFSLSECGLYFYYFEIETENSSFSVFRENLHTPALNSGDKWQITCFSSSYDTPKKFKGCVMYQIFPDRFFKLGECDTNGKLKPFYLHESTSDLPEYEPNFDGNFPNNDFFGGNLQGIASKLDYIYSLGVSVIYLNPIFKAYSNHRYDTADYMTIDPLLGTENDFASLCEKAHKMGISVILDGVFSHTGDNSIYFDRFNIFGGGAVSDPASPYRNWYTFSDYPSKYTSWWGIKSLPCVNELDPGFVNFIISGSDSVLAHWLGLGADGFRLDVADELPDEFIALLHSRVKELKPDGIVIGEVWEDASNKISYGVRRRYFVDSELDSVMNYPFKSAVISYALGDISVADFADSVLTICENYPKPVLDCLMNSLSTHDTARILTALGGVDFSLSKREKANFILPPDKLKKVLELERLCAFLQFVLPGSACIYYGDEIGMEGFEDPLNRGFFKWDDINRSLLSFYRALAKIKNSNTALKTGDMLVKECSTAFCAVRGNMQIIANTTDEPYETRLCGEVIFSQNTDCFGSFITVNKNGFTLIKIT